MGRTMNKKAWALFSLRLLLSWFAVVALFFYFDQAIVNLFLPMVKVIIEALRPNFDVALNIISHEKGALIQATFLSTGPIQVAQTQLMPAGIKITAGTFVLHSIVPLIILATGVLVYPVKSFLQRITIILLSCPFFVFLFAITTPYLLLAHVEMTFSSTAQQYGQPPNDTIVIPWTLFLEGGGRWLLPIVAIVLIAWLLKNISPKSSFQEGY